VTGGAGTALVSPTFRSLAPRWAAAAALVGLVSGCADLGAVLQDLGLPFTSFEYTVRHVALRGPYIDADLVRPSGVSARVFAFDTPECRAVLAPEMGIDWKTGGLGGTFARGDARCEAAGLSELASPNRPRPFGSFAPTGLATFEVLYQDEAVILLRGRFPLGDIVGFPAGHDAVAVAPNTETCRGAVATGAATMQYLRSPDSVLRLMTPSRDGCPLLALLLPPSPARE